MNDPKCGADRQSMIAICTASTQNTSLLEQYRTIHTVRLLPLGQYPNKDCWAERRLMGLSKAATKATILVGTSEKPPTPKYAACNRGTVRTQTDESRPP